ncbi:T6SS effector BTH_I2691 family protein [Luteimonas qiangzhengi]|uniref:T6SS effector BTH_I2691 family protein n=1 Tax=Luteimonas sp. MJ146 TaxID=3129240 RepID=UPI0031BA2BA1
MNTSSGQAGTADKPHRCPACTVIGLPIMPLRYGVAWAGDDVPDEERAPRLVAPFEASAYPELGTGSALYTLRQLRGGYLYVYEEATEEWAGYEVNDAGRLDRFEIDDGPLASESPDDAARCSRNASLALANCIQIQNAGNATKVWMAFSQTRWTPAVKARYDVDSYRQKHMRCIDASAWINSGGDAVQPHVRPLSDVLEQLPEYSLGRQDHQYYDNEEAQANKTWVGAGAMAAVQAVRSPVSFEFSPYSIGNGSRAHFTGVLWGSQPDDPAPDPPPLMVALDDPVGVAAELAALMNWRLENFLHEPGRIRPMAVSAAIQQLRDSVEHQAELKAADAVSSAQADLSAYAEMRGGPGVGAMATEGLELKPADLANIRRGAWKNGGYLEKYAEDQRGAWQESHEAELKVLDAVVLKPLTDAHVALLKGEKLQAHLNCNHDPDDIQSGAGYLGAVLSCIVGTTDKEPQAKLYEEWFEASPRDRDNLLLRAFSLNQDRIAAEVAATAESTGNLKAAKLPWDKLFSLYGEASKQLGADTLDAFMALLVRETLAPAAKTISKVVDGAPRLYGLAAWGMVADLPLEWVPIEGSSDQIVRSVMLTFQRELGFRKGSSAVRSELRRLQIYGVNSRQKITTGFIGLQRDGNLITRAQLSAKRGNFLETRLLGWRTTMDTSVRTGVGASLLSSLALFQLYRDATTGMRHQRVESWTRFAATATGSVAGAVEAAGTALDNMSDRSLRYARHVRLWTVMRAGGRAVGVVAGVVMAFLDFRRAWEERKEGNSALAGAYLISGVSGAVLAFAIVATAVFIGVIAFVALILASVFILWASDSAGHDWLKRCLWGCLDDGQKYQGLDVEMEEYKLALRTV